MYYILGGHFVPLVGSQKSICVYPVYLKTLLPRALRTMLKFSCLTTQFVPFSSYKRFGQVPWSAALYKIHALTLELYVPCYVLQDSLQLSSCKLGRGWHDGGSLFFAFPYLHPYVQPSRWRRRKGFMQFGNRWKPRLGWRCLLRIHSGCHCHWTLLRGEFPLREQRETYLFQIEGKKWSLNLWVVLMF